LPQSGSGSSGAEGADLAIRLAAFPRAHFPGENVQNNFESALAHVLRFEGGYSDHPSDPGGATNRGITKAVLESFRGRPVTKAEVRALARDEAADIYRRNYWFAAACDRLPDGLDLAVFDCAVNQGVGRAARYLQKAAGVTADGRVGPKTLAAVNTASPGELLSEFMALRMQGYGLLQKLFKVFGLGWSRRLMATYAAALALAAAPASNPTQLL
jgi:lysozyme family protein